MPFERLVFRVHALQRMFERNITVEAVHRVLKTGSVIEKYPEDKPYPSFLILGFIGNRPIHIVAADNGAPRVNTRGTLNPSAESAEAGKTLLRSVPACRQAGLTAELRRVRPTHSSPA